MGFERRRLAGECAANNRVAKLSWGNKSKTVFEAWDHCGEQAVTLTENRPTFGQGSKSAIAIFRQVAGDASSLLAYLVIGLPSMPIASE